MMPFPSIFAKNNVQPKQLSRKDRSRSNSFGNKRNGRKGKSVIKSKGGSGGIGVIGEHISTQNNFTCPEEEMFTINLESPVKNKTQDPDRSQDWPLLESSYHHDEAGHVSREDHHWNTRVRVEPRKTLPSATPEDRKSENVVNPTAVVQAPKKHKNHGRAEQLTRYIHKYECEDFMEYAVDIYQWKRSLEPAYQVEDWQLTQFEITPFMRYSLLDWLVSITRTLDFSLETWCLAVSYLDRFLYLQLIGKDCLQLLGLTALWLGAKQEELIPPSLDHLVALCADTFSATNFQHMELVLLAKLQFRLSAPTPAYHLSHLVSVEEERDWSEDLSRHMVELVMEDHVLARERPSKIAHAVYEAIKSFDASAIQILENCCPRCEPLSADMWSEELFQTCHHTVVQILTCT